jgi:hypothetical protein
MDFLSEVRYTTTALPEGDDEAIQAAFALACHPWSVLRHPDITAWDLFAMDLLAGHEALYPQPPPVIVTVGAPSAATSELVSAVADLATALAARLDDIARQRHRGVAQRLAHAAAAHQVQRAAAHLR